MENTTFETIYNFFLGDIEDKNLPRMSKSDQERMLQGYLLKALSIINCNNLRIKNDLSDFNVDDSTFNVVLEYAEIEAITQYMIGVWYESYVNSLSHTLMFWGSKDERYTDQKKHMEIMKETQQSYFDKGRRMFSGNHVLNNSYLLRKEE